MLLGCHDAGIFTLGKDESIKRVDVYGDQHLEGDDCRGDPLGFRHGGQRLYNTATYDDASASEYGGDHDHDDSDEDWLVACAARGAVT